MKLNKNKGIKFMSFLLPFFFFNTSGVAKEILDFNITKIDNDYSVVEIDFDKNSLNDDSFENEDSNRINYENLKSIAYDTVCNNKDIMKSFSNVKFHLDIEISVDSEKYSIVKDINSCIDKDNNFENK